MSREAYRIIDDLIIIGRSIPEEISDHRQTICVAGYSSELGLIRLYPTRWDSPLNRWNIVKVPVEKPIRPQYDPRPESWKIQGSRSEWSRLSDKIEVVGRMRKKADKIKLARSLVFPCVSQLRDAGRSLGVIKPDICDYYYVENPRKKNVKQQSLDDSFRVLVKDNFEYIPKIKYTCSECGAQQPHDQQLLEWGFYEGMRKRPDDIEGVWDNLGFHELDNWDYFFVVGNLFTKPKAFNIISILRFKK